MMALVLAILAATVPIEKTTVAYGADARQRLDLYRPTTAKDRPVLVFVHGGVWQLGDRSHYENVGEAFARRGIVTAVVGYRLTPQVRHPAHAQDIAAAVGWLKRNVAKRGGDPRRIVLAGHSAGGHLVSLLLYDEKYLGAAGVRPDELAGVIPLSGIFDLTRPIDDSREGGFARFVHPVFSSDKAALLAASPITYAKPSTVPVLLLVGEHDYRDLQKQSALLRDTLKAQGMTVPLITVPHRDHFALVGAIGTDGDPTTEHIAAFSLGSAVPSGPSAPSGQAPP